MSYRRCPLCGSYLDCGEKCDCKEKSALLEKKYEQLTAAGKDGQIRFGGMEDACTRQ